MATSQVNSQKNLRLIEQDDAISRITLDKDSGLVFFVGAGVSYDEPAGCPLWSDFIKKALEAAVKGHSDLRELYNRIEGRLSDVKTELICQLMHKHLRDDYFGYLDILYHGEPNGNHLSIAHLMKTLVAPLVITTNFDRHIENAFKEQLDIKVGEPNGKGEILNKTSSAQNDYPCLWKIHGCLDDRASMITTLRHAGREAPEKTKKILGEILESKVVVVVGYSGNDDDLFPLFLQNSDRTKLVYWVLRDGERSINRNIRAYAETCEQCVLVDSNRSSIFEKMADAPRLEIDDNEEIRKALKEDLILRWAASIELDSWNNLFCDFLLQVSNHPVVVGLVSDSARSTMLTSSDPWNVINARMNLGNALVKLEKYEEARMMLGEAMETLAAWGRPREFIECVVVMVSHAPDAIEWKGRDILFHAANYAGKFYDPYMSALYNYAAGKRFVSLEKLKEAEEYFFVGAGYAKQCGDQVTLMHCLDALAGFLPTRTIEFKKESDRIRAVLTGQFDEGVVHREGAIIGEFVEKANKDKQRMLKGDLIVVFIISIVMTAISTFFLSTYEEVMVMFIVLMFGGVVAKMWNAKKALLQYPAIERT